MWTVSSRSMQANAGQWLYIESSCRREARAFKLGWSFIIQCTATGHKCDWPTLTKWLQSWARLNTSCECECEANLTRTWRHNYPFRAELLRIFVANFVTSTFASHSHSQEVWTGLYSAELSFQPVSLNVVFSMTDLKFSWILLVLSSLFRTD